MCHLVTTKIVHAVKSNDMQMILHFSMCLSNAAKPETAVSNPFMVLIRFISNYMYFFISAATSPCGVTGGRFEGVPVNTPPPTTTTTRGKLKLT